jgi:hypothetical protein
LHDECSCTVLAECPDEAEHVAGEQVEVRCDGVARVALGEKPIEKGPRHSIGIAVAGQRECQRQKWRASFKRR